jgi:CMP-N-acetylneuraminic acid synthetase
MRVLTIIPARAGSKRCPGKNWEKVGEHTLLERAIICAELADTSRERRVFVVSDRPHPESAFCCKSSCARYVLEPSYLATDDAKMSDVVSWFCARLREVEPVPEAVVLLQPTSPLRHYKDVQACISIMERSGCDSVVSVTYDLATKGYKRNGAIYLARWELAQRGELMGGFTQFYVMPPERSIDIDTPEDLAEARRLAGDS